MNDDVERIPMRPGARRLCWLAGALLAVWGLVSLPVQAQGTGRRITAQELGLLINTADPYSVEVGAYYARRRGISANQILRVQLPLAPSLTVPEFEALAEQVRAHMGPQVQGLALAWMQPYAVECNSLTAALAQGFQPEQCQDTCAMGQPSRFFNVAGSRPFSRFGVRPTMMLAARSVSSAKALIDRGVAADGRLGRLGGPPSQAVFVHTHDVARNVRAMLFPPVGEVRGRATQVVHRQADDPATPLTRVVLYQTGLAQVPGMESIVWQPGALADHLTSSGGRLLDSQGQTSALDWIEAGATASFGTVSEPCNHVQKFPHPKVVLGRYLRGASALEAYWGAVAWPAQGVFIGEPLAAPYAR